MINTSTKSMPFVLLISFIFFPNWNLKAQINTQVREIQTNKDQIQTEYAFTVAHITDIHIGEGIDDFGTPGFLKDTLPSGIESQPLISLFSVVNWINENKDTEDIRFVVVTGDITGSAEESEYRKAKEILDRLTLPYVVLIGNHDIWPYINYGNEAEYAYGDSLMMAVFEDNFQKNKLFFDAWDDGTRLTKTYDEESGHFQNLINFSFAYKGHTFISLDWNPRYHVRKAEPGIGPEPSLHDYVGGTLPWFVSQLEHPLVEGKKNIVVMSHHPPQRDISALFNFGFTVDQYEKLSQSILPFKEKTSLWLAGHVHRSSSYTMRTMGSEIKIMDVRETASNKEYSNGLVTLIRINQVTPVTTGIQTNTLSDQIKIYPNPSYTYLNINVKGLDFKNVEVYDLSGAKVLSKEVSITNNIPFQIDISVLPQGLYVLQINGDNFSTQKRFAKLD
ncbi:MAG: metallophosphoesterase [Chitinophagales bacterium]|nr:metallophosphoesterase [Chitinophagales bacterium]